MVTFGVTPKKEEELQKWMRELNILERDLTEEFEKGGGSGGQKVNKAANCVVLTHRPTGIKVKCHKERSQALNRFFARRKLCELVDQKINGSSSKASKESEKIRKQKARRARRRRQG